MDCHCGPSLQRSRNLALRGGMSWSLPSLSFLRCEGIYIYSYRAPQLHIYPPMASNHTTEAPMDTPMAESQTSGEDSQPPAETGINPSDLPQEEPKFFCACRRPALKRTSGTARNPGRRFFTCYSGKDVSMSYCPYNTIIKNVIVYLANQMVSPPKCVATAYLQTNAYFVTLTSNTITFKLS